MDKLQLKDRIIARITEIDDEKLLNALDRLLETSNENVATVIGAVNNKLQHGYKKENEDFNNYIKEWVKNM
ncbi:MAG TPA: hypothetical protein VJ970_00090 [Flavobacteriaceae bacterium]|nr:hypothetical protein [Flavobacteriaceae bacterium]